MRFYLNFFLLNFAIRGKKKDTQSIESLLKNKFPFIGGYKNHKKKKLKTND